MAKPNRFGRKQKRGSSRARYFAVAKARVAANKEKAIKKDQKLKAKAAVRKERVSRSALPIVTLPSALVKGDSR